MLFKVSRKAYVGGDEYLISRHDTGQSFYRGPSISEPIFAALSGKDLAYFDWGYDEATHSVDLDGGEVPAPTEE